MDFVCLCMEICCVCAHKRLSTSRLLDTLNKTLYIYLFTLFIILYFAWNFFGCGRGGCGLYGRGFII